MKKKGKGEWEKGEKGLKNGLKTHFAGGATAPLEKKNDDLKVGGGE